MEVISYNNYAGFTRRLIAHVIDWLIISMAFGILFFRAGILSFYNFWALLDLRHHGFGRHGLLFFLFTIGYYVLCESSSWQGHNFH